MDNNIKIAIVDSNKAVQETLLKSISNYHDMKVTHVSNNGQSCIDGIEEIKPDILVMDMFLSKVAGFELLDYIKDFQLRNDLTVIVTTILESENHIKKIIDYNVENIYYKPYNSDDLIKMARSSYKANVLEKENQEISQVLRERTYKDIRGFLISLGIKTNLMGFSYLQTAIFKAHQEEELLSAVTKELYPLVGKIYQTKGVNVERAMRNAIHTAWKNQDTIQIAIDIYGYTPKIKKRPTNSKLIAVTNEYLKTKKYHEDTIK